jgi:hypothetical protein
LTSEEQLARWVAGESVHIGDGDTGRCCPDFSEEERQAFQRADRAARESMMRGWLGKAIATYVPGKKVYIAGDEAGETEVS